MPLKCIFSKLSIFLHAVQLNYWSLLIDFLLHFLKNVFQIFLFFFKTKSHSYLFLLLIYDLVLWFTMKIQGIPYVSIFFLYTTEAVFAYLFLLPFVLTSLSLFSTSLIVLSLSSSLGSLPLLTYHINVY